MMEWIASIPCGKAIVTVPFTGGSLSGYGIVPAQYMTENPFMQAVVENSDYYKNGKIILIREIEGSGKYQLPVRNSQSVNHMPGQAATASAILDSCLNPDGSGTIARGTVAEASASARGTEMGTEAGTEGVADGMTVVEVTDIDDAREYLVEKFSMARSTLRYKSNVLKEAEERRIKFVGLED